MGEKIEMDPFNFIRIINCEQKRRINLIYRPNVLNSLTHLS